MSAHVQSTAMLRWRAVAVLFLPSTVLAPIAVFYQQYDGAPHFFLHTLMGWDVGLAALLLATLVGGRMSRADGVVLLVLALYAMTPDFIYEVGPFHRDWMDVFLFHVSLDELLPLALPVLAILWVVLVVAYFRFRALPLLR